MIDNFNNQLLLIKKEKFIQVVIKICKERNLPIPKINFDGCPDESSDQLAHYHSEENKICCSERQLNMQNFDDIFDTASHEVAHILELNHDSEFIKQKILNDKTAWMFPAGVTIINGNQSVNNSEREKSKKYEQSLQKIQEEIEQKEEQNILREHPLAPQPKTEQDNNELTTAEIEKLLKNYNTNKNQLKQEEPKKYIQSEYIQEKKESNIGKINDNKQNTSLIKKTKQNGIIERIKCFFGFHNWIKLGGAHNAGRGKFSQIFICKNCKKTKKVIG